MTAEQLELLPETKVVQLTDRQQLVHQAVQHAGPDGLDADQAGALAHGLKEGRWAHGPDDRCQFCGSDGRQILEALATKGLVRYRRANRARNLTGAWFTTDTKTDPAEDTTLLPGMTDEIPY